MKISKTKSDQDQTKKAKQRARETLEILEDGFKTEKRIHNGYKEFEEAKKRDKKSLSKFKLKQMFGKWQYMFTKGNMQISLIKLNDSISDKKDKWYWEMHAFEDKRLFEDVRKFPTKKAAMEAIRKLLSD